MSKMTEGPWRGRMSGDEEVVSEIDILVDDVISRLLRDGCVGAASVSRNRIEDIVSATVDAQPAASKRRY